MPPFSATVRLHDMRETTLPCAMTTTESFFYSHFRNRNTFAIAVAVTIAELFVHYCAANGHQHLVRDNSLRRKSTPPRLRAP